EGGVGIRAERVARGCERSRKRVARLMRVHGLAARRRRRFCVTTQSRHPFPIAPNVLARQFKRAHPDQAWVTDITYIPTGEGWLYLAVILDLCSRFAVGWAMSARITDELTLDALGMALARRRPLQGLLHHSDRGSRYASGDYQQRLVEQWNRVQHEPPGQLLGQRRRRELLCHAEGRARPRRDVGDTGVGAHGTLRLHRAVLQRAAAAFGARL